MRLTFEIYLTLSRLWLKSHIREHCSHAYFQYSFCDFSLLPHVKFHLVDNKVMNLVGYPNSNGNHIGTELVLVLKTTSNKLDMPMYQT